MRRFLALALLLTFACSTTIHVARPVSNEDSARVASLLREQDAIVTYAPPGIEPEKDVASDVVVARDRMQWTRWESEQARSLGSPPGQRVEAPIDAVKNVSICEPGCHSKGFFQGAGVGALAGGLLSVLLVSGCKSRHDDRCELWWIPAPILGTLVGGLIGARGTTTNLDFRPAPTAK